MIRTTLGWVLRLGTAAILVAPVAAVTADALAGGATRPEPNGGKQPPKGAKGGKSKNGKSKGKGKKGGKAKNDGVGPFAKDDYPYQERLRPLVLPDRMGEITIAPSYTRTQVPTRDGVDAVDTTVDFDYGLGDVVQLGVGSGVSFAPDVDWSHEIHAHVHWLAYDTKEFDLAPGVVVPFQFVEGAPLVVSLDALGRYVIDDHWYLTFGRDVFDIGVNPDFTLDFHVNGGVGYQVSKPAVLFLDANLLTVPLAPDPDVTGPWETLNVTLGGQYTPARTFDLGLALTYGDTWKVSDEFVFDALLYGRIRF